MNKNDNTKVTELLDEVVVALVVMDSIGDNVAQAIFDKLASALSILERSFYEYDLAVDETDHEDGISWGDNEDDDEG